MKADDDTMSVSSNKIYKYKTHYKKIALKQEFAGANSEELWKQLCAKNIDAVHQCFDSNKFDSISAQQLAAKIEYDEIHKFDMTLTEIKNRDDKLIKQVKHLQGNDWSDLESLSVYEEFKDWSYKKMLLKHTFELIVNDLQHHHNFELIYEFIKVFGDDLENIKLRVFNKAALKSNHYWMMVVISKLQQLKVLKFYKDDCTVTFDS